MAETETDRAQAGREKQLDTLDRLAQSFGKSLSQALGGSLGAGRQLDTLLGTLTTKLSTLALKAALTPVKAGITGLVKGALNAGLSGGTEAFARGGVIAQGRVRPFAAGGIVAAPTYFPMQGGHGLMGEAGPEAILPLKRGSDGRLGVAAGAEARGGPVTVNITTPDIAGFRRSEAQVAAGLARAVARGRRGL
ncbi:phage tail tape measure protein [Methylobacterium sp. J-090]|uniref:phage tail tape measure protein n=1 Tax=Methylobacterium sp. J-090 TaxID=2836666 RepID=UPI001FBA4550|nr:phage tail tape measure protein [Methylobacterium sp. J-090]MCJ2081385.1 phage tail tape measure protein [Methylobacterium sp. J-090]